MKNSKFKIQNLKKVLVALVLILALPASALAFSDIPSDAWYRPYVDNLASKGVIDSGDNFRPAESLNRAELVKLVIEATTGIEDYQAPAFATFDDVPKTAWFAPYVETAATLGIVSGYKDANGSLTGIFGPADIVTRAAATKILAEAFKLELNSNNSTSFQDVNPDEWYYYYVRVCASNGIVNGYGNYLFGPNDAVSRAQIAKMISLALEAEEETAEEEVVEDEEVVDDEEEATEETTEEVTGEIMENNPALIVSSMVEAGANEAFVARYRFQGNHEEFYVTTVTVVNDLIGDYLGDDAEGTFAVKNVIIKYPDENGYLRTEKRAMNSNGKCRFSGLEFYVPRDEDAHLEIYAELNDFSEIGEQLSGEEFRLGLQNINNDTQVFRAIGAISNKEVTFGSGALFSTGSDIATFIVRKSAPIFALEETNGQLLTGTNKLIEFSVTAPESGSISLGRMVLEVILDDNEGTDLSLSNFKLYRGGSLLNNVILYDATGGQDMSDSGGGVLIEGGSDIIISFTTEEIISAGDTRTYTLKADAGSVRSDDDVIIRFAEGDEQTPLSGLSAEGNENTGKIFVNGDASAGIFSINTDFSQSVGTNRNIIWSDHSAGPHNFGSFSSDLPVSDSSSSDWTNGYLLNIHLLDRIILSR